MEICTRFPLNLHKAQKRRWLDFDIAFKGMVHGYLEDIDAEVNIASVPRDGDNCVLPIRGWFTLFLPQRLLRIFVQGGCDIAVIGSISV